MAADFVVEVGIEHQCVEPDGSVCACCEDACLLAQWSYFVVCNGKKFDEPAFALCGSCHEQSEVEEL